MLLEQEIHDIAEAQKIPAVRQEAVLERRAQANLPGLSSHALIITGIRRCGKSTLLKQIMDQSKEGPFYLNFEDPRLYPFEMKDFARLDKVISAMGAKELFFDEIQIVEGWELYIRQKLDEGHKVVLTGSNATLLSSELGTRLTGRHITEELFPFSFREYCEFKEQEPNSFESVLNYLSTGGVPEYVKSGYVGILNHLFDDILTRDIAVRYGIRDVKTLQNLALYLISNVGKSVTGNRLRKTFEVGATSTVMEHLSYLESSYLFFFVPKFSYSLKKQSVNPRKVYSIDTGLVTTTSLSFSGDLGRKFENLVYLYLRQNFDQVFYFSEKYECDFVAQDRKGKIKEVVQATFELNRDNLDRELKGIEEALAFFNLRKGTIVTLDQEETIKNGSFEIQVMPAYRYFSDW